jgi:hypothetical protein
MYRTVNPAAFLIAILTVGISPLTTVGPWDKMNTIIVGVVGAVLVTFTWPGKEILQDESDPVTKVSKLITAAQALVYGLIITMGVAWPVQQFALHPPDCPEHSAVWLPRRCMKADEI